MINVYTEQTMSLELLAGIIGLHASKCLLLELIITRTLMNVLAQRCSLITNNFLMRRINMEKIK